MFRLSVSHRQETTRIKRLRDTLGNQMVSDLLEVSPC